MTIDLIVLGHADGLSWPGRVMSSTRRPRDVARTIDTLLDEGDPAWVLFWDDRLPAPSIDAVEAIAERRGEVLHAGLRLGTGGLPRILDLIRPTWMLNGDPDPGIEATSWRLSLSACLVRADVLRQVGGVDPVFDSLSGAALEMGLRYVDAGVIVRHVPELIAGDAVLRAEPPTVADGFLIAGRAGRKWLMWALFRAIRNGYPVREAVVAAYRSALRRQPLIGDRKIERLAPPPSATGPANVSVIVATLDRFPFLRTTLRDLGHQTVAPLEVIVVDQSDPPVAPSLAAEVPDLPVRLLRLEEPGQCSARNLGIKAATGELLMFIDDDVEMGDDLIEAHLRLLESDQADVSCGSTIEVGTEDVFAPADRVRIASLFPTNNVMVRRSALVKSGLFDLAFDRGARADHDLGTRIYRSGGLMLVNPQATLTHLRAPRGGLRTHGARVRTFAGSRTALLQRHLPSATEFYLTMRYFSPMQRREASLIRLLGTFQTRGGALRRVVKVLIGLVQLPHTLMHFRRVEREARRMLADYPQIEELGPRSEQAPRTEART